MDLRIVLASNQKKFEQRRGKIKFQGGLEYVPSYNIAKGQNCYIITLDSSLNLAPEMVHESMKHHFQHTGNVKIIRLFRFGLEGVEQKRIKTAIRSEGNRNLHDDPQYTGSNAIFLQKEYKRIVREQRCLVLADAFIVGIERERPYLIHMRNKNRPFTMAGLWNTVRDKHTGNEVTTFGLLTVAGNRLMQSIGIKRMPVILNTTVENSWLRDSSELSTVLSLLKPFSPYSMNAYPILPAIANVENNAVDFIKPAGRKFFHEENYSLSRKNKHKQKDDSASGEGWGAMMMKTNRESK